MEILNKITNIFKRKTVEYGGFEMLKRMTGTNWSKTKMLQQYEKSLYVFACVHKIAEKIASTDVQLFQVLNSKGDTKELFNHPALDLLYKVNPFQTKSEFFKITTINLKLAGDAFWYKVRNERGAVVELWNLRPDLIEIVKDPTDFIKAYRLKKSDGTEEIFAPDDIVHFKHPTPLDDYYGVSPVKSASVRIDTEDYASNYQRDFFLNNARPDAAIKTAGNLTDEQKVEIRENFEQRHSGKGRNSKLAIFEAGLEYQQLSITQREMDYIESMKFTRDDILVAFGVPKAIVSITDDVNRANAETSMYIFLSETIKPELESMYEKANEELIMTDFAENLFIKFPDPTPENREQTIKEYESGIKTGYFMINEVRSKENLAPVDGGWALYLPLNMIAVGELPKKNQTKHINDWEKRQARDEMAKRMGLFNGRDMLYKKFLLKEKLVEELKKKFKTTPPADKLKKIKKTKVEKDEDKKPAPEALIKGELREKYAGMVIKQIDARADRMKLEITKLAQRQGDDLIDTLAKVADLTKTKAGKDRKAIGKETTAVLDKFYTGQEKVFAEFSFPFIEEFVRNAGLEAMALVNPDKGFEITDTLRKAIQKRSVEFGLGINKTTRDKINTAIEAGLVEGESLIKISDRINVVYEEFPTWRSDLIARTESTAANNEGFIEAYKQSDVATHKEWIATMDSRTRPEHVELDGEIVKVGAPFSNGLQYPREPNCRCVLGPAFEN